MATQTCKCCKFKGAKVQRSWMLQTQGSKSTKVVDAAISRVQKYKRSWTQGCKSTKVVDLKCAKIQRWWTQNVTDYWHATFSTRTEVCSCAGTEWVGSLRSHFRFHVCAYAPINVLPHLPPYWQKVGIWSHLKVCPWLRGVWSIFTNNRVKIYSPNGGIWSQYLLQGHRHLISYWSNPRPLPVGGYLGQYIDRCITCTNFMVQWLHASAVCKTIMCKHYLGAGQGTRCRYEALEWNN